MDDGEISGVQRKESMPRALDIYKIHRLQMRAAFPNSIILSVNHNEDGTPAKEDDKWEFKKVRIDYINNNTEYKSKIMFYYRWTAQIIRI